MECQLTVKATPRAKRVAIEVVDGVVRVWVRAAPTDGQANEAVRRLLARRLGLAMNRLTLLRGETARIKVWVVEGLEHDEALLRLGGRTEGS